MRETKKRTREHLTEKMKEKSLKEKERERENVYGIEIMGNVSIWLM